jgi:hypothetical protein
MALPKEEVDIDELIESIELFREALPAFTSTMTNLKESVEGLMQAYTIALMREQEAEREIERNFIDWKGFLEMQPERLQPIQQFTQKMFSPMHDDDLTIESVPEPKSTYAKTHTPGAIYRAGANEWYVESGTNADSKGGSGYLVTRQWVPKVHSFRWFCTCVAAKRSMYSEEPYCKHMYAVQDFIISNEHAEPLTGWVHYTTILDAARFFVHRQELVGFTAADEFYLDELKEVFPDLEGTMAYVEHQIY